MNPSVPLPFPLQAGTASQTQADEAPSRISLSTMTWAVLALVIVAVVVF